MPFRSWRALTAVLLVATACSGAPRPTALPGPTLGVNACVPGGVTGPTAYPGWPGGSAPADTGLIPLLVSSELAVGENRFLFTLIDDQNRLVASRDVTVDLRFYDLANDPETAAETTAAAYLETDDRRGLYRAQVDFGCSGDWGAEVTAHFPAEVRTARVVFPVRESASTPDVGERVPSTETPTATTPEAIAAISTDDDPDPDFYRTSETEALSDGEPFAIVFATPLFCQTRACGPTLDIVKEVAADYKGRLTFIHAEPYVMQMQDGVLQPVATSGPAGEQQPLQPTDAVRAWGLLSEPYTFVVGGDGRLIAKFEGIAGRDELREAFEEAAEP